MRLTQAVEYALRAIIYLASKPRRSAQLAEIAKTQNIPPTSLSPVLNRLAKKGIIISQAGYKGGYRVGKNPDTINLRQVIEAMEGPIFYNNCLIHGAPCASEQNHWCPIHEVWEEAKKVFLNRLERYSLQELAERVSRWNMVDTLLKEMSERFVVRAR